MNKKTNTLLLTLVVMISAFLAACQPGSPEIAANEVITAENNANVVSMAGRIQFQDRAFASNAYEVQSVEANTMAARIQFQDRVWGQSQSVNESLVETSAEMTMADRLQFHDDLLAVDQPVNKEMSMAERIQFQDQVFEK